MSNFLEMTSIKSGVTGLYKNVRLRLIVFIIKKVNSLKYHMTVPVHSYDKLRMRI